MMIFLTHLLFPTITNKQTTTKVELANLVFRPSEGGGGGVTQQRFVLGGSALRSNPLPFCVPFLTEKVPLKGQKARKADRTRMFSKPNDSKVQIQ